MAPLQRKASSLSKKSSTILHPTHPEHPLEEITNETEYSCDGCNTSGVGTRYHCSTCSFDLHEHCGKCPDKLSSYVHPRHALLLENKVSTDRFCDVCGELVNGLFYSCEACEIDIHPLCTLLALNATFHLHPQHVLRLQPGKPGWCAVCREICNFWRYRCNTCCYDVHAKCVLTGSLNLPSGHVDKVVTATDGGGSTAIQAVPQQPPPESYPPAGEVRTGGGVIGTRRIPDSPSPAPVEHGVGVHGSFQEVPHQAPQQYPPSGYAGEVGDGVKDNKGIANPQSPSLPFQAMGHGVGGLAIQGMPYPPPQSFPMTGYGVDVFNGGGSPMNGTPHHQRAQSYPVAGYDNPTGIGGSPTEGKFKQQAEAPTYPPTGYAVEHSQGGFQMPMGMPMGMMMNPENPMGMMMAQPPTMVIYHQNHPGQGSDGMNQKQKGMNQVDKPKKNNDEFDDLEEVGKAVKKKMQLAAKFVMGVAGMTPTSPAANQVNVSPFMNPNMAPNLQHYRSF